MSTTIISSFLKNQKDVEGNRLCDTRDLPAIHLNRSCPAVSHICKDTGKPKIRNFSTSKSTPIVVL
jgi:hypothetical protein